jgi:hypothetical protein
MWPIKPVLLRRVLASAALIAAQPVLLTGCRDCTLAGCDDGATTMLEPRDGGILALGDYAFTVNATTCNISLTGTGDVANPIAACDSPSVEGVFLHEVDDPVRRAIALTVPVAPADTALRVRVVRDGSVVADEDFELSPLLGRSQYPNGADCPGHCTSWTFSLPLD